MKNFRVRRIHIVCLAIATAEILIAAFVLWKNAIWNETQIQTANKQSVLSETQEETTSDIQENEKTATQNQEETKPVEEAVSSMPSMRVKLKNSDNTSFEHAKVIITCPDTFHIQSGTKEQIFTGGQTVTITPEHPFFQEGSIRVASEGGFVIIDSILRRGISHEYEGVLDLYLNVVDGLVVYDKVIIKHMMAELPFMATENIMMDAVKAGGDRQELHEKIRELSMIAGKRVKQEGLDNNLLELIAAEPMFGVTLEELQSKLDPMKYVGRSKEQVDEYLANVIKPILDSNKEELGMKAEINV